MTIAERIVGWIYDYRWLCVGLCLAATVVAGWQAASVGVDNAIEIWFVEGDPAIDTYHEFQKAYGNDEMVVVALEGEAELLSRAAEKARAVEGVAGVDQAVLSKTTPKPVLLVRMEAQSNMDAERPRILSELSAALDELDAPYRTAGMGVVYEALNKASTVDSSLFIGLSYLLIVILLWVLFRRLLPMLLALGIVGVATAWLLGVYGAAGKDINMVTMVMPTLILIVGLADVVHILVHVAHDPGREGESRRDRVVRGVAFMLWPCLFNTLTTVGAFAALAVSPLAIVRDLGIFSAVGLLGVFVIAIVGCTWGLHWERVEPRLSQGWLYALMERIAGVAIRAPKRTLVATAIVALAAGVGVFFVEADTYSIDYLYNHHPVRQDSQYIEENFGPYMPLEFVVESENPQIGASIEAWMTRVGDAELAGWGTASSGPPNQTRVTFGIANMSAREMGKTIEELVATSEMPADTTVRPDGYLPLYVRAMDYIVSTQVTSFVIAFSVIFVLIGLLFRSLRAVLLAVPSNLLPVLITLGVMGFIGIRLDVATVTIAAVVLGLVVDDTVQFLYRLRHDVQTIKNHEDAVRATVRTVGRSMGMTTVVLVLGFSVIGLAQVKSIAAFGVLLALAMGSALITDLLVVSALVVALRPRFG